MLTRRTLLIIATTAAVLATAPAHAQDKSIVVASTTSTQDSGLFGHICSANPVCTPRGRLHGCGHFFAGA